MPTILGSSTATEQPIRYGHDPQRGSFTVRSWRGIKSAIDAILPELSLAGYKWEVTHQPGDIWEVSASIAADTTGGSIPTQSGEQIVNEWELLPNVVQKDILESNTWLVRQLDNEDVNQIRYWTTTPPENKSPAWNNATYQEPLFNLMQAGVKSVTVFQPVLRHTWMIPKNMNPGLTFGNIGRILSVGALQGEGLPNTFLLSLSEFSATYEDRGDDVDLVYGWLKSMPNVQVGSNGRTNVTVEYQYGQWAPLIYGDIV